MSAPHVLVCTPIRQFFNSSLGTLTKKKAFQGTHQPGLQVMTSSSSTTAKDRVNTQSCKHFSWNIQQRPTSASQDFTK